MRCREISWLGIFLVFLLPALVFAGPILELLPSGTAPGLLPAPIMPKFPPEPVAPYVQPQPHPPEASDYISGIRYYLRRSQPGAGVSGQDNSETSATTPARDSALLGSLNMSTDSIPDVEPSIIAINKNGTVWTTSVYIKADIQPGNVYVRNVFSTTTDFTTVYKGELALPAGYQFSSDPFLAANPYSSGVAPGRIYASALLSKLRMADG